MSKIESKRQLVSELVEELKSSEGLVISNFSGLSVNDLTTLRKNLNKEQCSARVVKNRMMKLAFDELNIEMPEKFLKGPNIFFNTQQDVAKLSSILVEFSDENESLVLRGGVLSGSFIDQKQIDELSKLPSKPELIAKAVGLIKAPLTGLVGRLSSPVNGFIAVLNNIKNKNSEEV